MMIIIIIILIIIPQLWHKVVADGINMESGELHGTPGKSMRSGLACAAGFEHDPRRVATSKWNGR